MNTALRERLTPFHRRLQQEWVPWVEADVGQKLTPVMERLLRICEQVEIERFVPSSRGLVGRPPVERAALARAFVAKAVPGLTQTSDLVERLNADALLRRLCGFDLRRRAPLSASVHDSQVAIPLALTTAPRVTHLYDLMDAAYCSPLLRAHSESLGHVPLIDHKPRGGDKIEFAPHQAQRFKERSTVERVNVRGPAKGMTHLMFGARVLAADQLLRWVT